MRGILGLILGVGVMCSAAFGQEAPKAITVKVIVGEDGSIKVIDANTGKALHADVLRLKVEKGAGEAQPRPTPQRDAIQLHLEQLKGKDKELEHARQVLERLIRERDARKQEGKEVITKKIKVIIGPDGKAQIITDQEPKKAEVPQSTGVDKKLDLILKQLEDLRRNVDSIKRKLDLKESKPKALLPPAKKIEEKKTIIVIPGSGEIPPDVRKRLDEHIKKLEGEERKKVQPAPLPNEAQQLLELQRAIEAIQRQVEDAKRKAK